MDHKLIRAIGSVTCVMLLVKVLAMIKNILQARVYGAGVDADVFTLASSYSISLFTTMSYALCIAAIPILTQKLFSGKETCYQTANVLIANTMVLSLGATGVLFFAGAVGIIDPLLGIESNIPLFRFLLSGDGPFPAHHYLDLFAAGPLPDHGAFHLARPAEPALQSGPVRGVAAGARPPFLAGVCSGHIGWLAAAVGHGASQHASGSVSVSAKAGLSTRGLWFLSAHKRDDHVCLLPVPAVLFGELPG